MQQENGSILYRLLVAPQFRPVRNLVAVLCVAVISLNVNLHSFVNDTEPVGNRVMIASITGFIALLLAGYLHIRILVPRYLLKKRYAGYVAMSALSVVLLAAIKPLQEYFVTAYYGLPNLREPYINGVTLLDSLSDIMLYMLCLTGAAATVVLREWMVENSRRRELERKRLESEVESIKQQADPDVLLTTLERAASFATEQPSRALEMVMLQSKLLRYQLYEAGRERVMLKSEIDHIENYLRLKHLSDQGFGYEMERFGEINSVLVPPLLMASIIRKTMRATKECYMVLRVGVSGSGEMAMRCRIAGDGEPDLNDDFTRLKYLCGDDFSLTATGDGGDTVVELTLRRRGL